MGPRRILAAIADEIVGRTTGGFQLDPLAGSPDSASGIAGQAAPRKAKKIVGNESPKKETFEIAGADANEVYLVGSFTGWDRNPIPLKRQRDGMWKATVLLKPGAHEYRFVVDGQWRDDTHCRQRRTNPYGSQNCVREVAP